MPYHPPKGSVRMNMNVDGTLHYEFRLAAASEGKRMTDVLIEFMRRYVAEHARVIAAAKKAKQ